MPRIFKLVSIAIHAIVIALVFIAQAFDTGPLPQINLQAYPEYLGPPERDVWLPPVKRPAAPDRAVSLDAAPIVAPQGVTEETGLEPSTRDTAGPDVASGDPAGMIDPGSMPGAAVPPPPPPPPPPPATPIRLHQGIQPPRKIVDVQPIYPLTARLARKEGIVILETVIDANGVVESVRVLRGYPLLDDAAVSAVRQWRFTPALLNGQPVPVVMTVTVNFQLQ